MRSITRWLVLLALVGSVATPLGTSEAGAAGINGSCKIRDNFRSCVYGPFWIGHGANNFQDRVPAPKNAGWIRYVRATLLDKNMKPMDHRAHLHHASWSDPVRKQLICDQLNEVLYITGKERTAMRFPRGHAYHWESIKDEFLMDTMLHGMHANTRVKGYVRLNYRFIPQAQAEFTPVRNNWLPVTGCQSSQVEWDVNEGDGIDGRARKSYEFEMPVAGRFVWGTGHVHDGGLRMTFRNLSKGASVFVSRALYAYGGWELTGTTNFSSAQGVQVDAGDELKVSAVYDSTNTWTDVMGNLRASFVPDTSATP